MKWQREIEDFPLPFHINQVKRDFIDYSLTASLESTFPRRAIPSRIFSGLALEKLRRMVFSPPPQGWKAAPGTKATFCCTASSSILAESRPSGSVTQRKRPP